VKGSVQVPDQRLVRQLSFVIELDKLKRVLRRTLVMDGSRRENSAEHSWHLALMAVILAEYSDDPVDVAKVVKMVLVHDVIEIDAGDTFCYDQEHVLSQVEREQQAAARLFALLPPDQAEELRSIWDEFELRETPEARFAVTLDRLQPFLSNIETQGGSWTQHAINLDQVEARMAPVANSSTHLAEYMRGALSEAVARGYIVSAEST
jgi:putative hydrolases of HD superfamily